MMRPARKSSEFSGITASEHMISDLVLCQFTARSALRWLEIGGSIGAPRFPQISVLRHPSLFARQGLEPCLGGLPARAPRLSEKLPPK